MECASVIPDNDIIVAGPADSGLQIVGIDESIMNKVNVLLTLNSAQLIDLGKVETDTKILFQPVTGLVRTSG